jgi:antitoxin ChpS
MKVKRARPAPDPTYESSAHVTVSGKRQITIPSRMAKQLGLEAGGMLVARLENGTIVLTPRPKSLIEYLDSFPAGVYGRTKEEIDAYVRDEREGWERRARIAEGDPDAEGE